MNSLRSLTIVFLIAFSAATVLTGYATFTASRAALHALVDRRIDNVADALLAGAKPGDAAGILARIDALSHRRDTGDLGFELEDDAGRRIGGNVTLAHAVPFGFSSLGRDDDIAGLSAGRVDMRDAGGGLRLITLAETEPVDGYAFYRARNTVLGFGSIVLIVAGGIVAFGFLVRRRIREVRTTAEAIIDGDMTRRVPGADAGGAFAEQARAFNRMLDRIAGLMDGIRSVSNDVAHDLRTPLARLRHRLAAMAASPVPSPDLLDALDQCDAILALFAAILRIAEIDGGGRRAGFTDVDAGDLIMEACETMAGVAAESGHWLRHGPVASPPLRGDRQLLAQALLNLVENALRHTPAGTTVNVSVATTVAGGVAMEVRDDGPGIAASDRAMALRRFGRLECSRHAPGHGLGLPLVEAIARLHGGVLLLDDARPGLRATLALPWGA